MEQFLRTIPSMSMNYSLAAFQEPRGVMRILQFIFAVVAFSSTSGFEVSVHSQCFGQSKVTTIEYPFHMDAYLCAKDNKTAKYYVTDDLSSDAQFFVATGVLSMLYCIFIIIVYAYIDELYRTKTEFPLADFILTTILAIFWLSGSSAWSNGAGALKDMTDVITLRKECPACTSFWTSSFSKLNVSLTIGFLNFFLWASDLWFIYKETIWFTGGSAMQPQGVPPPFPQGPAAGPAGGLGSPGVPGV